MTYPKDIKIIDTMLGIPTHADRSDWYRSFRPLLNDQQSRDMFKMPAQYMFKDIPEPSSHEADFVTWTIKQMNAHNIEMAMIGFNDDKTSEQAAKDYPKRFFFDVPCNPNDGMKEVKRLKFLHKKYGIKSASVFPAGTCPQVAINDARMYPLYAACVELDIPIVLNVGVPGPRIPMHTQKVEHLDEVCWFFPDLKIVMRHGAEPWENLAVKLMIKYPNLYYSTSAFAPKHYPKAIIEYANTRGADKIIYAGYFPMGLSLDRIFSDMENVPLKAHVWPKFLRENAIKVFKLKDQI